MKIKCPICGIENNGDKTSCKACGAPLKDYYSKKVETSQDNDLSLNNSPEDLEKPTLKESSANEDNEKIAAEEFLEALEEKHGLTNSENLDDSFRDEPLEENTYYTDEERELTKNIKKAIREPSDDYIIVDHSEDEIAYDEQISEEIVEENEIVSSGSQITAEHLIENEESYKAIEEAKEEEYILVEHSPEEKLEEYEFREETAYEEESEEEIDEEELWEYEIYPEHSSTEDKSIEERAEDIKITRDFIEKPKEKWYKTIFKREKRSSDDKKIDKDSFRYVHRKGLMILGILILIAIVGTITIHYIDENSLNYLTPSNSEPGEYTNNIISFKLPTTWEKYNNTDNNVIGSYKSEKDGHRILLSVYQSKVSGRNLNEIKSSTEELDIRSGALINRTSTENISNVEVYDILSRDDTNNYQYRSIGFIKDNKEYAFLFVSDDIDTFNKDINSFKSSLEFH